MTFSFESLLLAFEQVKFRSDAASALPEAEGFIAAMAQVGQLFDHLGTGFGFVRKDIESKVAVVKEVFQRDPERNADLQTVVEEEVQAGKAQSRNPPSVARTVLRLMWAEKFLYILMNKIGDAVQPGSHMTLRSCVGTAYDNALKEHHGWVVQKAAHAAMLLLPDIDSFLNKLNVDRSKRGEYLERIDRSLGPLVSKMYAYYDKHSLHNLP
mmetsp:Transcript_6292/g.18995  ORF Transcript_6292/g.18995 Transcript_6292/m.18995 type:complete len:211 (-) Transcript_6292:1402-2034(-)